MTTEKKPENTPAPVTNDNKTVFGPLGKYAIIAVIMVSIIVTTAIMLDKQLNTVDQQIAAIENEVAEMHSTETATTETATVTETAVVTTAETEINETAASETTITEATITEASADVKPDAEVLLAQETAAADEAEHKAAQSKTVATAPTELAEVQTSTRIEQQARRAQLTNDNQARIEAYKLEQKKHMTTMFARIKVLESQQLDRYKANQNKQIVRLRDQIAQQQKMIETLIVRNKDMFELRAANVQRNQSNREQVLNRI